MLVPMVIVIFPRTTRPPLFDLNNEYLEGAKELNIDRLMEGFQIH